MIVSTLWIIITIILFLIGVGATIYAFVCDSDVGLAGFFGGMFLIISIIMIIEAVHGENKSPSAIDVYRGKTTLQITYVDSTPVDTTVVWKEEK